MKCFIHTGVEAIAACKTCGKGMCSNCSAYSGHTGVCPQCRKAEFEKELVRNKSLLGELGWAIVGNIIMTILLAVTVIGGIIFLVKTINRVKEKKETEERILFLTREIDKLNMALRKGTAVI